MRNLVLTTVLVLAAYTALAHAFGHSAHGSIPPQYLDIIPDDVRAWKITCVNPETGHGSLGPLQLANPFPKADNPFKKLGGGIPIKELVTYTRATSKAQLDRAKEIARNNPAVSTAPHKKTVLDIINENSAKYRLDINRNETTRGYYALATTLDVTPTNKDMLQIRDLILGNTLANSADDPLIKACPFEFTEGIRFGMTKAEVFQHLEAAWKDHPEDAPWKIRSKPKTDDVTPNAFPHRQGSYSRPPRFEDNWARYGSRPGTETLLDQYLTLYFAQDQLVAVEIR